MLAALQTAGNPGRGAHEPTLHAARIVYDTRTALAELFHAEDPACIAFAANATQALNTAIGGLLSPGDHVIATVCEHNSVLRPLYRLREQGGQLSFVGVDDRAVLRYEQFEQLVRPNTRAIVVTGASNVTGHATDLPFVAQVAKKHGLLLIVDAAQTAGSLPIDVQALGIDVLCFTGHKGLMGPQGTGGLYVRPGLRVAPLVVGGSGVHSFAEAPPCRDAHGVGSRYAECPRPCRAGGRGALAAGTGGRGAARQRNGADPVVLGGRPGDPRRRSVRNACSPPCADRLAEPCRGGLRPCGGCALGGIRHLCAAGAHCAPQMHRALGTVEQGVVRFSFSHQNTETEVQCAVKAVRALALEE